MDDLEFRRTIYADPYAKSDEISEACRSDKTKKQFIDDMQVFDKQILSALTVDIPESLDRKIILNQTLGQHAKEKRKNRIQLALAASVAFAVGIAFSAFQSSPAFTNVGEHAIAHVYHEQGYFDNASSNRVTLASVNSKLSEYNAHFIGQAGELISAGFCRFGGTRSLHLTFKGKTDIVTVFVLPVDDSLAFVRNFSDEKLIGEARTINGHHIIVVSDKNESVDDWQGKLDQNIQWSI